MTIPKSHGPGIDSEDKKRKFIASETVLGEFVVKLKETDETSVTVRADAPGTAAHKLYI
jgi:hypothetical protein